MAAVTSMSTVPQPLLAALQGPLPELGRDAVADGQRHSAFWALGEAVLAALPPRAARSPAQAELAALVHERARRARDGWLGRHAVWLYDLLTDQRRERRRMDALCGAAAQAVPGLVPTAEQMAADGRHLQAEKEGRELDQALLLAAWFSHAEVGAHLLQTMRTPTPQALEWASVFGRTGRCVLPAVTLERLDGVAHLTVTRPDSLNAEDDTLIANLEVAVDLALLDPQVRVGLLRGGPVNHPKHAGRRIFSAGINLKHLHAGGISFVNFLLQREVGYISKIYQGLWQADGLGGLAATHKPWLAAVDRFAIGGGAQLLLVFDHVVAASDSYFCLPAAQEGIIPGVANLRLPRAAGPRLSRQVILGGRVIHAGDPEARCVFDEVVAPEHMDAAIDAALARLDNPAVTANRTILNQAEEPLEHFRAYMATFARLQAQRAYSADVTAKVARRAPAQPSSEVTA